MSFWRSGSSAREALAQVIALGKSQAVIEFNLDGTIITANQNFLDAMGYRLDEIHGKHHSMFVMPEERAAPAYRDVLGAARPRRISVRRIQAARQGRPRDLDPGVLQSDPRRGRQAGEGRQVRDRHHRAENPQPRGCRQDLRDRPRPGRDRVQSRRHHHHRQREFPQRARLSRSTEIQGKHHSMFVGAGRARQRGLSRVLGQAQPRRIPVRRVQAYRQGRQGGLDPRLLQSDPRRERQAVQGGEIRDRRQRAEAVECRISPARSRRSASRRP